MTRDQIIQWAREAGFFIIEDPLTGTHWLAHHNISCFERFAQLARADEREACAKVAYIEWLNRAASGDDIAAAIRSRKDEE